MTGDQLADLERIMGGPVRIIPWRDTVRELEALGPALTECDAVTAVLPPEMVIHRLTGDGAKKNLIAPLWTGDKKRVLNAIRAAFRRDDLIQGAGLA